LTERAAATSVSYATARRRYESGTLPVPAYRPGRLIMVGEPLTGAALGTGQVVVHAGVWSAEQKSDLDRQVDPAGVDEDLVRDVAEILTLLCAHRAAAGRVRQAVDAVTGEAGPG
jgi:predicted site-specific integrase-resolvase